MQATPFSSLAVQHQLAIALQLAIMAVHQAQHLQLGPAALLSVVSSVGLLLGAGRACLGALATSCPNSLLAEVLDLHAATMHALLCTEMVEEVHSQLASDFARPQAMASWLSTVVAAANALPAEPGQLTCLHCQALHWRGCA